MDKSLRGKLKKITPLKLAYIAYAVLRNKHGLPAKSRALRAFFKSYQQYQSLPENKNFSLETADLYPRLFDDTEGTPVDPVYFYQDAWLARKIFEAKPAQHTDIGSHLPTIGIISQFVPTTMVDIRPPEVMLFGLSFTKGSILGLPFRDNELSSLSSICVIEHIGLGRYGDPLDTFGSEKAVKELVRVLANGGNLYISVPIDSANRVYFNAHRAFTREYVLVLFKTLSLIEEKYVYGSNLCDAYDATKGFGTGLYHFKK